MVQNCPWLSGKMETDAQSMLSSMIDPGKAGGTPSIQHIISGMGQNRDCHPGQGPCQLRIQSYSCKDEPSSTFKSQAADSEVWYLLMLLCSPSIQWGNVLMLELPETHEKTDPKATCRASTEFLFVSGLGCKDDCIQHFLWKEGWLPEACQSTRHCTALLKVVSSLVTGCIFLLLHV